MISKTIHSSFPLEFFCVKAARETGACAGCDPSGRRDGDGKAFEPAQRVVVAALHGTRDLDGPDLARQRRQYGLAFEAGDELADAHVNARAIADMAAGSTRNVVA